MLNEVQEFNDYTQAPDYTGKNTLGRFTVESIRKFLGFDRIFTILARGYLFRGGDPYDNVETARKALCAWCSIPENAPKGWDRVRRYQFPIFLEATDSIWGIRFDDVIANALALGPLREIEAELTEQQKEKLLPFVQDKVKLEHLTTLVAYYAANKAEDTDWVVLPAASFNNYFGSTVFSKKVLPAITGKIIQRSDTSYGSGRYRVLGEFL